MSSVFISLRRADARTLVAYVVVLVFQQAAIWSHIPWADEAQAVVLARDSNSLSDWYWNFRYEGHPPLWHLYLKAWLLAGLDPFSALRAAASTLSLLVLTLICFASPFPFWLKLASILSEPVLFQFGVVSRSYSLGVALLVAAAALWRTRGGWLVIPALTGVSAQFIFIAAALVVVRARDRLPWRCCGLLVGLGSVVSIWFSRPGSDYGFASVEPFPGLIEGLALASLNAGQVVSTYFYLELALPLIDQGPILLSMCVMVFALVALVWRLLRADVVWLVIAVGFLAFTLAVSLFVYPLAYRHYALVIPLLISAWWIAWPSFSAWSRARAIWFAALSCAGVAQTSLDLRYPLSNIGAMGEWIRNNGKEDALFAGAPMIVSMELAPLARRNFKLGGACLQTFALFRAPDVDLVRNEPYRGQKIKILAPEDLSVALKSAAAQAGGSVIMVADEMWAQALMGLEDPSVRLLAVVDHTRRRNHARFIFDVRAPPGGEAPPRCSTRP